MKNNIQTRYPIVILAIITLGILFFIKSITLTGYFIGCSAIVCVHAGLITKEDALNEENDK